MKFTYKWLLSFLETNLSPDEIGENLVQLGIEVESIFNPSLLLNDFSVALIEEVSQHPNADRLKICSVRTGKDLRQIVCGAPNARAGIKVVLAEIGAVIPNGNFEIKPSKIRGIQSEGMLCSYDELNIDGDSKGIIELVEDASIGDKVARYLGLDDVTFEVAVTPNRGDWLSVYGIARDMAAKGLGRLKKIQELEINSSFKSRISPRIESKACKFLALIEIKDLHNAQSPDWLQKLLKNIGMNPVSAIIDITNYFAVSFARPLHAYDVQKIHGNLIARNANSSEKFIDLAQRALNLHPEDLIIGDESGPQALAGIIGGEYTKCSTETCSIILESACFDKISITNSGRRHNIITDARKRFERGIDDFESINMLKNAAIMIQEICGGSISDISVDGSLIDERLIEFDPSIIAKRIGIVIEPTNIIEILGNLGFEVKDYIGQKILFKIPTWRHDINCPEILAEEVARIFGYENITSNPLFGEIALKSTIAPPQKQIYELRHAVASLGYDEVVTWSFMNSKKAQYFCEMSENLYIHNPISQDLDYMRFSITPNLLEIISKNHARSLQDVAFFETGPVFLGLNPEDEIEMISGAISGAKTKHTHLSAKKEISFFDIKSDVDRIISELGYQSSILHIINESPKYYHPGRSATYKLGKKTIAYFGQLHPKISTLYGIETDVYAFEILVQNIVHTKSRMGRRRKATFSPYQMISRDYAMIFDKELAVGNVINALKDSDELIKNIEIFDVYECSKIGDDKKSIAFRVFIQSDNRTLSDSDINGVNNKILGIFEKAGGVIRD